MLLRLREQKAELTPHVVCVHRTKITFDIYHSSSELEKIPAFFYSEDFTADESAGFKPLNSSFSELE